MSTINGREPLSIPTVLLLGLLLIAVEIGLGMLASHCSLAINPESLTAPKADARDCK